jgi:peptide/nickel transport system substrate-binding protein
MRPVQRRLVASVVFAALLLSSCGQTGGSPQGSSTAITRGGTLTLAIWQEPNTLNAYYATQTVASLVYRVAVEGLIRVDPDGNYVPWLAKEVPTLKNNGVKLLADGKKMDVTYKLLPGVLWSDGKPFTSEDVKFTWQAIIKDPKVTTREGYDVIESVDTPDPLTVVMHYKEIYAPYATRFTSILPKHVLENVPDIGRSEYVRLPLGTGPFRFTEFKAADHITAEKNPNYRVKGKPYLDRIIFRSVPSREAAVAQLKAGEVDGVWNLLESQLPDLEKNTDIRVFATVGPSVERLEFNLAKPGNPADPSVPHPVLADLNMRRALLLATPKQKMIDRLLFGKAKAGTTTLSLGWAAPKDLKQEDYDPTKAKQLLDQGGWTVGADGIRTKGGTPARLKITTTTGDKVREQVELILVDEWKQIGVKLEINNVPSSVLFGSWSQNAPRKKGNFDINMYASSPDIDPHETVSGRFHSKNIPRPENSGAGFNYYRFSKPEVDRLIDQAGASVDQEARKKLYNQILKIVNDNVISVWLYNRSDLDAFRTNVVGPKGNAWDRTTWTAEDWFVRR